MKFTQKKLQGLPKKMQQKKILEFIYLIEKKWQHKSQRRQLLFQLGRCLKWMGEIAAKDITSFSLREFLAFAVPLEQNFGRNLRDDKIIINKKDNFQNKTREIPLTLILDNLRSAFNVGAIFRIAECFNISQIICCGYTPTPQNPKVIKTAMGTTDQIKWESEKNIINTLKRLKDVNNNIYALETVDKADSVRETKFNQPAALILGNEALGIEKEILELADKIVQIPLYGGKNSLNVATAAAISCYEISEQWR